MTANVLRAIVAVKGLLALLWLAWVAPRVGLGWTVLALVCIAGFAAAVLAANFAWMHAVNRDDSAPRASGRDVVRAWWDETRTAYRVFGWDQAFFAGRVDDHLLPSHQGQRALVLVHGFVCNRGLWQVWMRRLRAQGVPHLAVTLEPTFGSIEDYVDTVNQAVERAREATGLAPVIVAHSMGGLATRAWLRERRASAIGQALPVHHVITVGTPHQGTLAALQPVQNVMQMKRHSAWLQDLARSEPMALRRHFTCFYGACDNIVFPASTATLAGAQNHHVRGHGHVHLLASPVVFEAAMAAVGRQPASAALQPGY
jgi:triacylglycerol lipase